MKHKNQTQKNVSSFKFQAIGSVGFTLIEILVVIGISVSVMTLIVTGYRRIGSAGAMERTATRLAQDIRTAQALALSSDPTKFGGLPPCGFGVHAPDPATGNPNSYIIYVKTPSSTSVPCGVNPPKFSQQWVGGPECLDVTFNATACPGIYQVSTSTVKRFVLPESGIVQFSSAGSVQNDIYFEPPDPATYILRANPGGSASTIITVTDASSFSIQSVADAAITRTVQVANSGRVQIIGGQILSKPCVPLTCSSFMPPYECGAWADSCGGIFTCGVAGVCAAPEGINEGYVCCTAGPCLGGTGTGQCYLKIPDDPTSLTAQGVSGVVPPRITLSWTDHAISEAYFEITRMDASCAATLAVYSITGNFNAIGDPPGPGAGLVTFTDYGSAVGANPPPPALNIETRYCYKVRATNGSGASNWSSAATAFTIPPAPDSFRVLNTGWPHRLKASWGPSCNQPCSYQIQRCLWNNVLSACMGGYSVVASLPDTNQYLHCDTNRLTALTCTGIPTTVSPCQECDINLDTANDTPLIAPNPPYERYATVPDNTKIFPNTYYKYILYADNTAYGGGLSAAASLFSAGSDKKTTVDILPNVPTGLTLAPFSNARIDVHWSDDQDFGFGDETSFLLYRCNNTAAPGCNPESGVLANTFLLAAGNNPAAAIIYPATDYQDQPLTGGNEYAYCVKASNDAGTSACSPWQIGTTFPGAPTSLITINSTPKSFGTGAAAYAQIDLQWTHPVPSGTLTGTKVQRALWSGSCGVFATIASVPKGGAGDNQYSETVLVPNTTYCYQVIATNAGGDSPPSNQLIITTPDVPPLAPSGLTVTVPAPPTSQADLAWTDNAGGLAWGNETSFRVHRCAGAGCDPMPSANDIGGSLPANPPGPTTYSHVGLAEDTTYGYCILARGSAGDSPCSNAYYITTFAGAPTNLQVTARSSTKTNYSTGAYTAQMTLTWTNNPSPATQITQIKIERAQWTGSCGAYAQVGTVAVNPPVSTDPSAQTFTNTNADAGGLTPNTSYCYRVRAANPAGDSAYSNVVSPASYLPGQIPTSLDVTPNTPTALNAVAASAVLINLNWNQNDTASPAGSWGNETSFRIRRCTGNPCTPVEISSVGTDIVIFANMTVEGTTYGYCLVAQKTGITPADSPCSSPTVYVTTPPNAPTMYASSAALDTTNVQLNWRDNSTGETNTYVERATGVCPQTIFATIVGGTIAGTPTTGDQTTFDTGTAETIYCYRARAVNAAGSAISAASITIQTQLNAPATFTTAPGSGNKVILSWSDNSNVETGYTIEYYCTGDINCPVSYTFVVTSAANATTYTHNVPGSINNAVLYYRIRALGAYNNSVWVTATYTQ